MSIVDWIVQLFATGAACQRMSINLAMWNIKDALFRVVNVLIDTGDTSTRARISSSAVTDHLAAQTSAGQVVPNDTVGTLRS